jgi:hypothetical protein
MWIDVEGWNVPKCRVAVGMAAVGGGREGDEQGCKREEDTHLLMTYQARATSRMQPMLNSQAGSMQSKHKPANLK